MAWRLGVAVATLAAFALRVHALADVPLRWDEGWSIALAMLPPGEMVRMTALDVHPPGYYAALAPWLAFGGAGTFWVRALSALVSTAAVPLAAVAAAAWWPGGAGAASRRGGAAGRRRESRRPEDRRPERRRPPWPHAVGLAAAAYTAVAPGLVYYAGVARMYAPTAPLLFLAAWGLARWAAPARRRVPPGHSATWRRRLRHLAAAVLGAAGAAATFYYAAFAVAGLLAAALAAWPRAWRRTVAAAAVTALVYLPWAVYALPPLVARVGGKTDGRFDPAAMPRPMADALFAALFAYGAGWAAVAAAGIVLAAGLVLAPRGLGRARAGALVLGPVALVLLGAAAGAQGHMFQPRYAVVATPFAALGLGWAVAALGWRSRWLGAAAAAALALAVAPTLGGYVYARAAEVDAAWDPAADWRELAPRTEPGDRVVFNILSLAGIYENHRTADDPPWTYAQLWDPVHEPLDAATARVERSLPASGRLWLVLYKGDVSPDSAALRAWADARLRPVEGWWAGDTRYQGYVDATPDRSGDAGADFGHGVRLVGARHSGAIAVTGDTGAGAAVDLRWRADGVPDANARVFVHAYGPDGALVAQHDGFPAGDARPPKTWAAGEVIEDRHGLWIPPASAGPLRIVVGLYDPATGERWRTERGEDAVAVGAITVESTGGAAADGDR